MKENFDIAIIGGGLAGLSLAILQAKAGKSVLVFEKGSYPSHKVCGEYISLESWDFLEFLGLPLSTMTLPIIKNLIVSSPLGNTIAADLDLGGFGMSRYLLDAKLAEIAQNMGVTILEKHTVVEIKREGSCSLLMANNKCFKAETTVGSFGKRSNLDISWQRDFISKNRTSLNQYIGVKYHVKADFPKDTIALHNFKDGYCGISAIEDDKHCLCYMTKKNNLRLVDNSIEKLEKVVLSKNPFLNDIFENSEKLWKQPLVISQISFERKEHVFENMPLLGDAAGMIAPLCGNGMSMALHSAKLMNDILLENHKIEHLNAYNQHWQKHFGKRVFVGRTIQRFFGNETATEMLIKFFKLQPGFLKPLIKLTHGKSFV